MGKGHGSSSPSNILMLMIRTYSQNLKPWPYHALTAFLHTYFYPLRGCQLYWLLHQILSGLFYLKLPLFSPFFQPSYIYISVCVLTHFLWLHASQSPSCISSVSNQFSFLFCMCHATLLVHLLMRRLWQIHTCIIWCNFFIVIFLASDAMFVRNSNH